MANKFDYSGDGTLGRLLTRLKSTLAGYAKQSAVDQLSEAIADLPNKYIPLTALEGDSTITVVERLTEDDFVEMSLKSDGTENVGSTESPRIVTEPILALSNSPIAINCPAPYEYIIYFYNTDTATSAGYLGKTSFTSGNVSDIRTLTVASGTMDGATHCRISLRDSTNAYASLAGRVGEFVRNILITHTVPKIGDPLIAKSEWVRNNFSTTEEMEEYVVGKIAEAQLGGGETTTESLPASVFEIGGIHGNNGADGEGVNRARTAQLECTEQKPISIVCDSSVKWLVHFFRNGTWLGKTTFASTNCNNAVLLYSTPSDVTHIRILSAYTSDADVTDIEDLLSHFTITRTVKSEGGQNIDIIVEAVLNSLPVYGGEVVE